MIIGFIFLGALSVVLSILDNVGFITLILRIRNSPWRIKIEFIAKIVAFSIRDFFFKKCRLCHIQLNVNTYYSKQCQKIDWNSKHNLFYHAAPSFQAGKCILIFIIRFAAKLIVNSQDGSIHSNTDKI